MHPDTEIVKGANGMESASRTGPVFQALAVAVRPRILLHRSCVHIESSLLSLSSGCPGFLRCGWGMPGPALTRSVRLDRGGTCHGAGPYGGGRPGSGWSEEPVCGV